MKATVLAESSMYFIFSLGLKLMTNIHGTYIDITLDIFLPFLLVNSLYFLFFLCVCVLYICIRQIIK